MLNGSPNFSKVIDDNGLNYYEFKKTLKPKLFRVYFEIAFAFSMVLIGLISSYSLLNENLWINFLNTFALTIWLSFWLGAYLVFFHEGAHFHINKNKKINDYICNIFFTPFNGMFIKDYRKSHWEHHKHLGTVDDTEISYFNPLNAKNILKVFNFLYLIDTILRYSNNFKRNTDKQNNFFKSMIIMFSFQFVIILLIWFYFSLYTSLAYAFTYLFGLPLREKIRQTLEHRDFDADNNIDYKTEDHGPINRIFYNNFFSKFFGAAGFNYHLLHHWDPSISYTNFEEVKNYLLNTELKYKIEKNSTSYFEALKKIIS